MISLTGEGEDFGETDNFSFPIDSIFETFIVGGEETGDAADFTLLGTFLDNAPLVETTGDLLGAGLTRIRDEEIELVGGLPNVEVGPIFEPAAAFLNFGEPLTFGDNIFGLAALAVFGDFALPFVGDTTLFGPGFLVADFVGSTSGFGLDFTSLISGGMGVGEGLRQSAANQCPPVGKIVFICVTSETNFRTTQQ